MDYPDAFVNYFYDAMLAGTPSGDYDYLQELAGEPKYNRERKEQYLTYFENYGIRQEREEKEI